MSACLSAEQLRQCLSAEEDAAHNTAAVHLEECPHCQQVLEEMVRAAAPVGVSSVGQDGSAFGGPSAEFLRRLRRIAPDVEYPCAAETPGPAAPTADPAKLPTLTSSILQVPGYDILEELGQGGMGAVYKARHRELNRFVALKVLTGAASQASRDRLRAEAGAVARVQHPHIVQIFEIGETDGGPFIALEYVEHGSLAQHLDGTPRPTLAAAQFVATMSRAVHAAHQRGIVHRDLKPANILLQPMRQGDRETTRPGENPAISVSPCLPFSLSELAPKIADFGLAKCLDDNIKQTESGAIVGTPSYMAPEQAQGSRQAIGPATDVYGLGAILYELLTGRPPFKGESAVDTAVQVLHEEPVPPGRLRPKLSRDLETICLKCLQKEPSKRYATAEALAEDLDRFVAGKPIHARPAGALERSWRWCGRNRAVAGLLFTLFVTLLAGIGGVTWKWLEADRERNQVVQEGILKDAALTRESQALQAKTAALEKAQTNAYFHGIALAYAAWLANDVIGAERLLGDCPIQLRQWEWHYLKRLCRGEGLLIRGTTGSALAYRPDGKSLATGATTSINICDPTTGAVQKNLKAAGQVVDLVYSPDGVWLAATIYKPSFRTLGGKSRSLQVWNAKTGQVAFDAELLSVNRVTFSADSKHLATQQQNVLVVWESPSGREVTRLLGQDHIGPLAFRPGGQQLAVPARVANRWTVKLWQSASDSPPHTIAYQEQAIVALAFNRDGSRLLTAGADRTLTLWDVDQGSLVQTYYEAEPVASIEFLPDGEHFVTLSGERTIKKWNVHTGQQHAQVRVRAERINRVAMHPSGERVAVACNDGTIHVLDALDQTRRKSVPPAGAVPGRGCVSPDGKLYAAYDRSQAVRVWDTANWRVLQELPSPEYYGLSLQFSSDSRRLAVWNKDRSINVWDLSRGILAARVPTGDLPPVKKAAEPNGAKSPLLNTMLLMPTWLAALNPAGNRLATSVDGTTVKITDIDNGQETATWTTPAPATALAFSSDGQWLARAATDRTVRLWDVDAAREVQAWRDDPGGPVVVALVFGRESKLLAAAYYDRTIRVWDRTTGQDIFRTRLDAAMAQLAFSANGQRLAVQTAANAIHLWDVPNGRELLRLPASAGNRLTFLGDGNQLMLGAADGSRTIWDGTPFETNTAP